MPTDGPAFLPPRGILLHIGPHKTGTSALQAALESSRTGLLDLGIDMPTHAEVYRGVKALAKTPRGGPNPSRPPHMRNWAHLRDWAASRPDQRLVISSEYLDDFPPELIQTLRASLGPERVRVMITVRPLERVLPSAWQQGVKTGRKVAYEPWLRARLVGPGADDLVPGAIKFWFRWDYAVLVDRWAGVIGRENVVVVVSDERQPAQLFRGTEEVLGVPPGTLQPGPASNRSLTAPEIAAVRAMFAAVGNEEDAFRHYWLHGGAVSHLVETRRPPADEPRLHTPAAATERIREISRDVTDRLLASGVRIIGDPHSLVSDAPIPADPEESGPVRIDPEIAALLVAGLYGKAAETRARYVALAEEARQELAATSPPARPAAQDPAAEPDGQSKKRRRRFF